MFFVAYDRIGRTARAGAKGLVSSIFGGQTKQIAEAVRRAVDAGEPVEPAFSRKRSFRKKLKRYGETLKAPPRMDASASSADE